MISVLRYLSFIASTDFSVKNAMVDSTYNYKYENFSVLIRYLVTLAHVCEIEVARLKSISTRSRSENRW